MQSSYCTANAAVPSFSAVRCLPLSVKQPAHNEKRVHFVRHGEGEHNAEYKRMVAAGECDQHDESAYENEAFYDARLTEEGRAQAHALAAKVAAFDPPIDLVVVSAMTRTMQTALGACSSIDPPFAILDEIKEGMTYGIHPCNRRSSKTKLQQDFSQHHQLDLSHLPEHDPHFWPDMVQEEEEHLRKRIVAFLQWLENRPEKDILVVTHCVVLFTLMNHILSCDDLSEVEQGWFEPGEMRSFVLQFGEEPGSRL
jgi:broad specificity phosphatase PhoE